jgi:hypothetical protein
MTDTYEARGPHLPDVLIRQSPWVYLFVAAAAIQLGLAWMDVNPVKLHIDNALMSLLGAALFVRHPDAKRSVPRLAFGLGLIALGPLLDVVEGPVTQFLDPLASPDDMFSRLLPAFTAYRVFTSLIAVAAAAYIGFGLAGARRRPRHPAERFAPVVVAIISIAAAALALAPFGVRPSSIPPYLWTLLGIEFVVMLLYSLAWAYVIAVTFGGWVAGDVPHAGWGLAFAAAAMGLAVRIISTTSILITTLSEPPALVLFQISGTAVTLSWLLLVVAFALGLPATADPREATPPGSAAG